MPYLGVNNPSISVFNSFIVHKILIPPKIFQKNRKNPKNPKHPKKYEKSEKNNKSKDFFEDLKSVHPL